MNKYWILQVCACVYLCVCVCAHLFASERRVERAPLSPTQPWRLPLFFFSFNSLLLLTPPPTITPPFHMALFIHWLLSYHTDNLSDSSLSFSFVFSYLKVFPSCLLRTSFSALSPPVSCLSVSVPLSLERKSCRYMPILRFPTDVNLCSQQVSTRNRSAYIERLYFSFSCQLNSRPFVCSALDWASIKLWSFSKPPRFWHALAQMHTHKHAQAETGSDLIKHKKKPHHLHEHAFLLAVTLCLSLTLAHSGTRAHSPRFCAFFLSLKVLNWYINSFKKFMWHQVAIKIIISIWLVFFF